MLSSNQAMFIAWGTERTLLYNDAYAEILASKHPALGRDLLEVWHEIRADLVPIVEEAYAGRPVHMDDITFVMQRRGYPEETHFSFFYAPIQDEGGTVAGLFCACNETTEKVLAERRVAAETLRQRRLFEQAPGFITILAGPNHVFEFTNAAYNRLFGDRGYVGKTVREAFPELEGQGFYELLDQVYTTGERFVAHHIPIQLETPGAAPEQRFLDFIYEPSKDEDGRVTGIFCEGFDVTDVHLAHQALRESEARFRNMADSAPALIWMCDDEGRVTFANMHYEHMFGRPAADMLDGGWADIVLPEDLERHTTAFFDAFRERVPFHCETRVIDKEGRLRWLRCEGVPRLDDAGRFLGYTGCNVDVTEGKLGEQRRDLLIHELNHRVKNTLATVQSIATQTLRSASDPQEAREAIENRLIALSRAHDVLTQESWEAVGLREVVERALDPFRGQSVERVAIRGTPSRLTPRMALALSMALHELATNAVKYGALSNEAGEVLVTWLLDHTTEPESLLLRWEERGGPPVEAPKRRGFGTRLIERSLASDLEGEVKMTFNPQGLVCTISAPMEGASG
jgi:PAS domain S-box-containing protein